MNTSRNVPTDFITTKTVGVRSYRETFSSTNIRGETRCSFSESCVSHLALSAFPSNFVVSDVCEYCVRSKLGENINNASVFTKMPPVTKVLFVFTETCERHVCMWWMCNFHRRIRSVLQ